MSGAKAIYARNKHLYFELFDTFEEARRFLSNGENSSDLWAIAILMGESLFVPSRVSVDKRLLVDQALKSITELGYTTDRPVGEFYLS